MKKHSLRDFSKELSDKCSSGNGGWDYIEFCYHNEGATARPIGSTFYLQNRHHPNGEFFTVEKATSCKVPGNKNTAADYLYTHHCRFATAEERRIYSEKNDVSHNTPEASKSLVTKNK